MADQQLVPELVLSGRGLLEAPIYDARLGFIFSDATLGGMWRLDARGSLSQIVPHRTGIGGAALHEDGGIVVSGRNVAYKRDGEGTIVIVPSDAAAGFVGFNDLTVDRSGRIYVGSVGFVPRDHPGYAGGFPGHLHRINLDGTSEVVAEDILLPNGLAFSPDGRLLYHSDSLRRAILAFPVDEAGDLGPRRQFAEVAAGITDGLAVADDGTVWLAACHAGLVIGYQPDGRETCRIQMPVPMVTSLCFGGPDGGDLYVVTGPDGAPSGVGGCVYRVRTGTRGQPRPKARIAHGGNSEGPASSGS
jgi:D-xylonolactonase